MNVYDLNGVRVASFVSGGLDSTTMVSWLKERGAKVTTLIGDLGQPEETDMSDVVRRMIAAGAEEAILVDAKKLLAEYGLLVVQGQGAYEGGYLNTTGIARMALIKAALPEIKQRGIEIVTHGATGRGNDQVRFEIGVYHLAPELQIYAPWRDQAFLKDFGGRKEMIAYCQAKGLKVLATLEKLYSTDSNLLGLTHEADKLEDLNTPTDFVRFLMGNSPQAAPDKGTEITIGFEEGRPVHYLNHREPLDIFLALNSIGGQHGIGIGIDVVENRRVGIKSRGVYESPGLSILCRTYAKLIELVLDRDRRRVFDRISAEFGEAIYRGEFFAPYCKELVGYITSVAKDISGSVSFELYKGNMRLLRVASPTSLYSADRASMEKIGNFDHRDSQGYLNIAAGLARQQSRAGLCGNY